MSAFPLGPKVWASPAPAHKLQEQHRDQESKPSRPQACWSTDNSQLFSISLSSLCISATHFPEDQWEATKPFQAQLCAPLIPASEPKRGFQPFVCTFVCTHVCQALELREPRQGSQLTHTQNHQQHCCCFPVHAIHHRMPWTGTLGAPTSDQTGP